MAIATRGRPMRLAGALHSFTTLQTGKHDIDYVIRVDDDDTATLEVIPGLKAAFGGEYLIRPRPMTLGQSWNEIAAGRAWDACCVIADKHLCLTAGWDAGVAILIDERKLPLFRWHILRAPEEMAVIMPRKWYDTVGSLYPEWFPFWFSETWVREVHRLAYGGSDVPMITDMPITEPPGLTQNLRDLEFWFDFFAKTRFVREREADQIAAAYDLKPFNRAAVLQELRAVDEWQKPRIPGYYTLRGERPKPPTAQYILARQRAQEFLDANILQYTEAAGAA